MVSNPTILLSYFMLSMPKSILQTRSSLHCGKITLLTKSQLDSAEPDGKKSL